MKPDAVSIVEAAYAIDLPEQEWVTRICDATWGAFGLGKGCLAYVYDASGPTFEMRSFRATEGIASHTLEVVREVSNQFPMEVIHKIYDPSPPTALHSETLPMSVLEVPIPLFASVVRQDSIADFVGVRCGGLERRGIFLDFPVTAKFNGLAPNTRRTLDRIAAHLAAAFRLRSVVGAAPAIESASAVLSPDARVEHLGDDSEAHREKGTLVDAVRRMERARGAQRRSDAEQGLSEWQALVRGRWSVLDFVDRDGKRFILARRNELRGRDLLAITSAERQVLELAALGHPNKLIAYELGFAQSTVRAHLKRGLGKLGLSSRAELIGLRLAREGPNDGS